MTVLAVRYSRLVSQTTLAEIVVTVYKMSFKIFLYVIILATL